MAAISEWMTHSRSPAYIRIIDISYLDDKIG